MRIIPNIGKPMRIGYAIAGAVLLVVPFATTMEGWPRVALPVLGMIALVVGAVGW